MRKRLIWTFALFALGLSALFGTLSIWAYHHLEDRIYRKQLAQAMKHPGKGSVSGALARVLPEDEVGGPLGARLAELDDGYHEFVLPPLNLQEEFHILLHSRPGRPRQVAIMRIPELEKAERRGVKVVWTGVLVLTMAGLLVGILLARHSVRPIEDLTAWLNRGDPTEPAPRNVPDEETRLLAGALESYLLQRNSRLDRERAFLREASHELRNPISIIKGVSELAEEQSLSPEGLQRIQRSVQRMEHTVEGLLALARREQGIQGAFLEQEWNAMLEEYREGFDGEIHSSEEWVPVEPLTARMIVLTAGTLLRNVIDHAQANRVTVTLTAEALEVRDDGKGVDNLASIRDALERGHPLPCGGLGLALVARICRRMEWTLTLENTPGLRAEVCFQGG